MWRQLARKVITEIHRRKKEDSPGLGQNEQ
jgi:hypothetical protein